MASERVSRSISTGRQAELEARFQDLDRDLAHQRRIVSELENSGRPSIGSHTVLQMLEREQAVIVEELGYNPRAN